MRSVTLLLLGVATVMVVLAAASWTRRHDPSARRGLDRRRAGGADPYAAQRTSEKLNPGLGDGCGSGGGG